MELSPFYFFEKPTIGKPIRKILAEIQEENPHFEPYIQKLMSRSESEGCIPESEVKGRKLFIIEAAKTYIHSINSPKPEEGEVDMKEVTELVFDAELMNFRITRLSCSNCLNKNCLNSVDVPLTLDPFDDIIEN